MNALTAATILLSIIVLMRTYPKVLFIILIVALVLVVAVSIYKTYDFQVIVTRRHPRPAVSSGGWAQVEIAKPHTIQVTP